MLTAHAVQGHLGLAGQLRVQHVGFLRAGEQQVAKATHGFLRDHRADGTHMLHIDLLEAFGDGGQRRTVLVGDDRRGMHDIVEHSGPPGKLEFSAHRVVAHLTVGQVGDQIVQPAAWNSFSKRQRSGRVSRARWSSYRLFNLDSISLKSPGL